MDSLRVSQKREAHGQRVCFDTDACRLDEVIELRKGGEMNLQENERYTRRFSHVTRKGRENPRNLLLKKKKENTFKQRSPPG